jgi:hypothetical protein
MSSSQPPETKRVNVNLDPKTLQSLQWIAQKRGISMTEVIKRAIDLEGFVLSENEQGSRLLIERQDGQLREVLVR